MPDPFALYVLTEAVRRHAGDEPPSARLALVCLIENRRAAASAHLAAHGAPHPLFGDGGLASAALSLLAPRDRAALQSLRHIAAPCGDPTGGALFFHAHDTCPPLADKRAPRALCGGHIFYR